MGVAGLPSTPVLLLGARTCRETLLRAQSSVLLKVIIFVRLLCVVGTNQGQHMAHPDQTAGLVLQEPSRQTLSSTQMNGKTTG